jgi:hypothetical protein
MPLRYPAPFAQPPRLNRGGSVGRTKAGAKARKNYIRAVLDSCRYDSFVCGAANHGRSAAGYTRPGRLHSITTC